MIHLKLIYFGFLVRITSGWRVNVLPTRQATGYKSALGFPSSPSIYLASKTSVNDADDNHVGTDSDVNVYAAKLSNISQPSKLDLYNSDELVGLLEIHQQLQPSMKSPKKAITSTNDEAAESPNDIFGGGLHDLILQTLDEVEEGGDTKSWISDKIRTKISNLDITAIASDVDGTIIGFDQKIHPRTRESIKAVQDSTDIEWIFPATGKTRWGARNSLGSELSSLTEGPGVYVQVSI